MASSRTRRAPVEPPKRLGDSHNFGRRVAICEDRVFKPRTLFWEWLVLGADSPLRRKLGEIGRIEGCGNGAFAFLPAPSFRMKESRLCEGGEVERLVLKPLPRLTAGRRRELAVIVGRAIALFSWLGVADLHWENLVLGARGDAIVFGPVDIEMILGDFELPTETKLLPDADPEYALLCQHAAGVRRTLPYLGKPIRPDDLLALASSYRSTLTLLNRHAGAIAETISGTRGVREAPIRVCLRATAEYVQGAEAAPDPSWLGAELEQMARGDVPYFFRRYGRPGIAYFADPELRRIRHLPTEGDVPRLEPLLRLSRKLRSPRRRTLGDEGLFALLGAFDHPSLSGRYVGDEFALEFRPRSIAVLFAGGQELEARRDLRRFVSSVYLPCRCGEVRSVFVPQVTRCSLA